MDHSYVMDVDSKRDRGAFQKITFLMHLVLSTFFWQTNA
jgi:hypothetical protein